MLPVNGRSKRFKWLQSGKLKDSRNWMTSMEVLFLNVSESEVEASVCLNLSRYRPDITKDGFSLDSHNIINGAKIPFCYSEVSCSFNGIIRVTKTCLCSPNFKPTFRESGNESVSLLKYNLRDMNLKRQFLRKFSSRRFLQKIAT